MQGRAGRLRSRFPGIGCGGQKKANNQASSSSRLAHFAWVFCLSAEQQRPEEKKERKKESWRGEESAWGGGLCACLVMKKRKMSFNGKGVLVVWLGFWFERCLLSANTRVLCVQRCNHKRVRRRWLVGLENEHRVGWESRLMGRHISNQRMVTPTTGIFRSNDST